MSLYRTWRPKSFADLVGQDAVVRTLTHAIEAGKLAHAYLFSGPRGSGKTSAAKILARCINCVQGPTAHPDNTCENCIAMLNGTALDVLEIDAASNRGIDEIRALRDAVKFAPSVMRMKVYIIDEAHMLTKEGANAFLKTLEEPPAHAVFILATTEPEKLPVTILSRCQRYAFRRISIPVMIERMREIATYEGIAIDEAALAAIAYRADGGLRDALTMLEQAAAFADGAITTAVIELAFGATGRNYANTLLDAVVARDAAATLRTIEEASDAGADMVVLTRALIADFRNLLVARIDPELLARDLAPEDAERARERADGVAQPAIVRALRVLADAASLARTGANPRLELETALLRLMLEEPAGSVIPSVAPPPVIPSVAAKPRSRGTAEEKGGAAPVPPSSAPVTLQKLRSAWQSIRTKVETERPPLRAPLSGAMVDAIDGNAVVLKLRSPFEADILKEHAKLLESAIADVTGAELKVRFEAGAPAQAPAAAAESPPNEEDTADELFGYANERIK
ncbi:MAG TPA: DNA polymerase III subunit gamma/tau [Candidatus Acidoferrales bacterium]|nr:DNA polymerase III subunit gamma/tau [Candidatus Acidoferrales bacterium]